MALCRATPDEMRRCLVSMKVRGEGSVLEYRREYPCNEEKYVLVLINKPCSIPEGSK